MNKPFFDTSRMHTLGDHRPFTAACRAQFGGSRVHLRLAWHFVWKGRLTGLLGRPACFMGHHRWQVWRKGAPWDAGAERLAAPSDYIAVCVRCRKRRTANEDEWW